MVKTMTPEVIPGAFYFPEAKPREIERYGDHQGSHSFNHCTSKNSQYLFYNTPNISKYCTIIIKLQTWLLQSTNDANTDCKNFYCCSVVHVVSCNPKWLQTINLSSSDTQRTSGYCTPCASLRTSARQTDALSHGRGLAKLRHVMWRALNQ